MSVRAMAWAFDHRVGSPMAKLVLLKLADHANEVGECFPSIERIADDTEMTQRSVIRQIAALETGGWLKAIRKRHGNRYRLLMGGPVPPAGSDRESPQSDTESLPK